MRIEEKIEKYLMNEYVDPDSKSIKRLLNVAREWEGKLMDAVENSENEYWDEQDVGQVLGSVENDIKSGKITSVPQIKKVFMDTIKQVKSGK